jgi:hypothetical protein
MENYRPQESAWKPPLPQYAKRWLQVCLESAPLKSKKNNVDLEYLRFHS